MVLLLCCVRAPYRQSRGKWARRLLQPLPSGTPAGSCRALFLGPEARDDGHHHHNPVTLLRLIRPSRRSRDGALTVCQHSARLWAGRQDLDVPVAHVGAAFVQALSNLHHSLEAAASTPKLCVACAAAWGERRHNPNFPRGIHDWARAGLASPCGVNGSGTPPSRRIVLSSLPRGDASPFLIAPGGMQKATVRSSPFAPPRIPKQRLRRCCVQEFKKGTFVVAE